MIITKRSGVGLPALPPLSELSRNSNLNNALFLMWTVSYGRGAPGQVYLEIRDMPPRPSDEIKFGKI